MGYREKRKIGEPSETAASKECPQAPSRPFFLSPPSLSSTFVFALYPTWDPVHRLWFYGEREFHTVNLPFPWRCRRSCLGSLTPSKRSAYDREHQFYHTVYRVPFCDFQFLRCQSSGLLWLRQIYFKLNPQILPSPGLADGI